MYVLLMPHACGLHIHDPSPSPILVLTLYLSHDQEIAIAPSRRCCVSPDLSSLARPLARHLNVVPHVSASLLHKQVNSNFRFPAISVWFRQCIVYTHMSHRSLDPSLRRVYGLCCNQARSQLSPTLQLSGCGMGASRP